jgi:hypothetical protein
MARRLGVPWSRTAMLSLQPRLVISVGAIALVLIGANYPVWASRIFGILTIWILFALPIAIAVGHLMHDDRQHPLCETNNESPCHADAPSVYPADLYDDEEYRMYDAITNENPVPAFFRNGTMPERGRSIDIFIGQRIAQRRIAVQLSLDGLASEASISSDRMVSYENGEQRVTTQHLFEIGRALGVGVGYFFEINKTTPAIR